MNANTPIYSKNTSLTVILSKIICACGAFRLLTLTLLFGAVSLPRARAGTECASTGEIVAATLILEAGGEADPRAMAAVREVIANRAKKTNEISVCLAPKQFSCWNTFSLAKGIQIAKKHPKWAQALKIAKSNPVNYTKGATHYHTTKVSPSWKNKLARTVKIGNHLFYK
jgi:hypothetical protein